MSDMPMNGSDNTAAEIAKYDAELGITPCWVCQSPSVIGASYTGTDSIWYCVLHRDQVQAEAASRRTTPAPATAPSSLPAQEEAAASRPAS